MDAVQGTAGNRAAGVMIQRAGGPAGAPAPAPVAAGQEGPAGREDKGAEVIARLSRSIEGHVVLAKIKTNPLAPGTWIPEHWMPEGTARLKRVLERRVVRGEVLGAQDLEDIRALSTANPQWLEKVGIGTFQAAEEYGKDGYKDWLQQPPGKRLLAATLAYRKGEPGARGPGQAAPIAPDYTLGRFMTTQGAGPSPEKKRQLLDERDHQIRQTAVDTLHPAGIAPGRRHKDAARHETEQHRARDRKGREILTSVLLVLQHGLKIYDPHAKTHVDYREGDVIRALAHGGRVNIRIPALRGKEQGDSLTDFLGVTEGGKRAEFVDKRDYATHRTAIGKNKEGEPGGFKEKGGRSAALANALTPAVPALGLDPARLMGVDIAGGGFGSADWNGDVVLPTGSHGHMLLVFNAPKADRDGSLLVGIETTKPGGASPVGYRHDIMSTEATANPESSLHGHKADKISSGGLKHNERLVELKELGAAEGSGDWRAFLDRIKRDWLAELEQTRDGSAERRAMYERLVGRRQQFHGPTG